MSEPGWGFVDDFFGFMWEVGFLDALGEVDGDGFRRRMIPMGLMLTTYSVKVLAGLLSMNAVPKFLLSHPALLMRVGFTARQVRKGFCDRGGPGKPGPFHGDTLADCVGRLSEEESVGVLDSTDLETTDRYEGCGRKTVEGHGARETKYGFKLVMLWEKEGRLPPLEPSSSRSRRARS